MSKKLYELLLARDFAGSLALWRAITSDGEAYTLEAGELLAREHTAEALGDMLAHALDMMSATTAHYML